MLQHLTGLALRLCRVDGFSCACLLDLHAELSRAAEREGTSLNASITRRLTESVGWGEGADHSEPERSRLLPALLIANAVVVGLAAILSVVILLIALAEVVRPFSRLTRRTTARRRRSPLQRAHRLRHRCAESRPESGIRHRERASPPRRRR